MKIAIVGSGQLARMMALSGWTMGLEFSFLADAGDNTDCVNGLGTVVHYDSALSAEALYLALGSPDRITVEKEAVNTALLRELQAFCPVYPDPDMIDVCRHRANEKHWLQAQGAPTAHFYLTNTRADIESALEQAQARLPQDANKPTIILKSCAGGYDGYSQWRLKSSQEVAALDDSVCVQECVAEERVDFSVEVSVIAARNVQGDIEIYPVAENVHRNGILLTTIVPAQQITTEQRDQAISIMRNLLDASNYVGVLTMECFVTEQGIVVNELAPRVHNSGHWSMNAGVVSQFENHVRAICGLPLGQTQLAEGAAGMVNLLGIDAQPEQVLTSNTQLHRYNKSLKAGRKMGHLNLQAKDAEQLQAQMSDWVAKLYA